MVVVEIPLEVIRYILSFFQQWRLVNNVFVNIEKLFRIPRPIFSFLNFWWVELNILGTTKKIILQYQENVLHTNANIILSHVFLYEKDNGKQCVKYCDWWYRIKWGSL